MGWNNPPLTWTEFERKISGRPTTPRVTTSGEPRPPAILPTSTAPGAPPPHEPRESESEHVPYAELHAHSHFSFLDGAAAPDELIAEATRLGLTGLAITDHDGFYGAAVFAAAAESAARKAASAHAAAQTAAPSTSRLPQTEASSVPPPLLTVYGSELSLGLDAPQLGATDPMGTHLLVLARGAQGYHQLASAITEGQLAGGEKGRPVYDLEQLAALGRDNWAILTGCRKGAVRQALESASTRGAGEEQARAELTRLTDLFGRDNVYVELTSHGHPGDDHRNAQLAALAAEQHLPLIVTGNVHYATRAQAPLAEAMSAVRARRSLDELDPHLPASGAARLRSGAAQLRRFARYSDAIARTVPLARELAFPLRSAKPRLPQLPVPAGHTPMSWLRQLVWEGAERRYGALTDSVRTRLTRELEVIEEKDFPGYFLIVHDLVQEARRRGILCQGRGSAANSAVCFVLHITAVDSIRYDLPFERFLSSMRDEEPDIDVDFDSERREEVIQYVYETYGRRNAAQVANIISYRPKAAIRDAAKALGYGAGQQRAWTKAMERWRAIEEDPDSPIPLPVQRLAQQFLKAPRHLGIHSGGMVLTERPVGEVCPIEHARMDRRTVLQWDKESCETMGLVKFDMLGLGMLSALQKTMDIIAGATGEHWTLETVPKEEPGVYDMLCRADAIGVFQLESRAQLNTLPRLLPRSFYDLVIEIALIRPGPIQGGAVHPYLRRRNGTEDITYSHPKLQPVLERTLGVPLFQEQLMQMAMAVGDCTAEDADLLRRAMGSKRGQEHIDSLRDTLFAGMARNGITGDAATHLYEQIEAFANFGFAESHSISFALLVYISSWFKLHYPGAFLAGLLRSQPMGFYAPRTLVADARRHGVKILPVDVQRSGTFADLEALDATGPRSTRGTASTAGAPGTAHGAGKAEAEAGTAGKARGAGMADEANRADTASQAVRGGPESGPGPGYESGPEAGAGTESGSESEPGPEAGTGTGSGSGSSSTPHRLTAHAVNTECTADEPIRAIAPHEATAPVPPFDRTARDTSGAHRRDDAFAVRLGLSEIRGIETSTAERIVAARAEGGPFLDLADLARRADLDRPRLEALAAAGACDSLGIGRREALWSAAPAADNRERFLPGIAVHVQPPLLPVLTGSEQTALDLWSTGIVTGEHPLALLRDALDARRVVRSDSTRSAAPGSTITVAGLVTHRQRPSTAGGITFLTLEDEAGTVNIVTFAQVWQRNRLVARSAPALLVTGVLERSPEGVVNVIANSFEPLAAPAGIGSRDFH
ncbi:error-prone DNA polymerase [Leucobacter luti]|uniref:error-prone DNA polymerase n=1 Tax=Leucobacter luti TaxID=340320 RepID=UPI001C68F757|nr:error-prone DNA polymerase [Leucobacter luti]QYM75895.1 error-prone DNA polymerase [Leucobacter luti]